MPYHKFTFLKGSKVFGSAQPTSHMLRVFGTITARRYSQYEPQGLREVYKVEPQFASVDNNALDNADLENYYWFHACELKLA